ncbi:hypothetical protein MRX96_029365 [Rhipicephalus microplus]
MDLRAQVRDEQQEKIALEERRLQAEERVLLLKLKLQEQKTDLNAGEIGRPGVRDTTIAMLDCLDKLALAEITAKKVNNFTGSCD